MKEVLLNRKIYTIGSIFSASYSLADKAYFLFDEDKEGNYIVRIEPKQKENKGIENEFKNSLLNSLAYNLRAANTKEIRKAILQRALLLIDEENANNQDEDGNKGS